MSKALSRTSRLRFCDSSGVELEQPPEWRTAFVEILDAPRDLGQIELRRNGRPLELVRRRIGGEFRTVAEWPLSGTGGYELELVDSGTIVERRSCTVHPEKLSEVAYRALLDDLQNRLPATLAIALQDLGALAGLRIVQPRESTLAEEVHRLRRACLGSPSRAGLIDVLRALARSPYQVLTSLETWTPRYQARRVRPTSLYQAFVRPMNLDRQNNPVTVPEHRVEHTVDTYENRLVRAFVSQVLVRLRRVSSSGSAPGAIRTEALELQRHLERAVREASFLADVPELREPPTKLTMVLTKRPEYRAALEGFLEFRRTALVEIDEPLLQAPLTNLPELYEKWGTLMVVGALLAVASSLGFELVSERLVRSAAGQVWVRVLQDGRPAVRLRHPDTGWRVALIPQRTYSAGVGASAGSGARSVSFAKRPDVAVELAGPSGELAVWLFDPKYKLLSASSPGLTAEDEAPVEDGAPPDPPGLPKPVDLNAMHAYRDAIRARTGERVVAYAATLYPGATRAYDAGLAAIRAYPTEAAELDSYLRGVLTEALDRYATDVAEAAVLTSITP